MDSDISRDSRSAWNHFCALGNVELNGRDADFEEAMRVALAPDAPDFDTALSNTSTAQLVQALFQALASYAAMFRDIIAYIKRAGAKEGRDHWIVKIGDEDLDLSEFERFLETWATADLILDVPAIGFSEAWIIGRCAYGLALNEDRLAFLSRGEATPTGIPEIDAWLTRYREGTYLPVPRALLPENLPDGLRDAAAISIVAVAQIRGLWGSRERMMEAYHAYDGDQRILDFPRDDGFSPGVLAQNETDFWLGSTIVALGRAIGRNKSEAAIFGSRLDAAYSGLPRRQFAFSTDVALLERLLALPTWRKRHELYAVWIGTEIVGALPDHDIDLHHEDGRLMFAFKKTALATIRSVAPEMILFSERKVALADPVGKGRSANVQPDYSLWSQAPDQEICQLVVEVKHYQKAARASFHAALVDYARAHPVAKVALVNHGPVGADLDLSSDGLASRCMQIGHLTSDNPGQRTQFRDLVHEAVGPPLRRGLSTHPTQASILLLIDISGSMKPIFKDPRNFSFFGWLQFNWLSRLASIEMELAVLADTEIRERCTVGDLMRVLDGIDMDGSTALRSIAVELLEEAAELQVITDQGGVQDLLGFAHRDVSLISQDDDLWLVTIRRSGG